MAATAETATLDSLKSPFSVPSFALPLVVIQRLVVQIKAIEKDDVIVLCGRFAEAGTVRLDEEPSLQVFLFFPQTPNLEL